MRDSLHALVRPLLVIALAACGPDGKSDSGDLVTIEIEPANAMLTYTGTPVSLDYKAIGHYADGSTAEIPDAVFSLDAQGAALGAFSGVTFTVSGQAAGKGTVFAQSGDITGATSVIVVVHRTEIGPAYRPTARTSSPTTSRRSVRCPRRWSIRSTPPRCRRA